MSKSDKELTIDIVNSYLQACSKTPNTIQPNQVVDFISNVYKTINNLDNIPINIEDVAKLKDMAPKRLEPLMFNKIFVVD
ncbi:MAG: hypothetical protein A2Y17_07460 [Clostridiales bacterium GWF2_38_85]|nr:MAG: hypothetical protein A2Y17_07460 [Clostridiales bacterium GWF2_38_85]HBL84289.1 hypothetical protein [Clostridiales bacterium]